MSHRRLTISSLPSGFPVFFMSAIARPLKVNDNNKTCNTLFLFYCMVFKRLLSLLDDNKLLQKSAGIVTLSCDENKRCLLILLNGDFHGALGKVQLLSVFILIEELFINFINLNRFQAKFFTLEQVHNSISINKFNWGSSISYCFLFCVFCKI
jgi:hypothetical protein